MNFLKNFTKYSIRFHAQIYSLLLPTLLLFHNSIDFSYNGARRCYKECLSHFVTNFADEMEDKRGLKLINHMGCMGRRIHSIGLHWQVEDSINVARARLLILELMDAFLVNINSFKRLQPYLDHCPWTICNISEFRIDFVDDCYNHYPSPGTLSNVTYMDGTITYNVENPRCLGEILKIRDEPYHDALQFVGWFYGKKHYNSLLNPMPPPGDFEDVGDWLMHEAKDFYNLKRRLYYADRGRDIVSSPSIAIVNVSGKSTQGTPSFSLTPVANPFGTAAQGQMAQNLYPQAGQGMNPNQLLPQNQNAGNYGYGYPLGAGGVNPLYGGAYNNLNRLDPRYNSLDNSQFNETRFGQENPFNPRQTLYNPMNQVPRANVGGLRR